MQFFEAVALSQADVQAQVRRLQVLRWIVRQGLLEPDEARAMWDSGHGGGFSVDASVRVEAWDWARVWSA